MYVMYPTTTSLSAIAASAAGVTWSDAPGPMPTTYRMPCSATAHLVALGERHARHRQGHRTAGTRFGVDALGHQQALGARCQQTRGFGHRARADVALHRLGRVFDASRRVEL